MILPASQTRRGGLSALSPTRPDPFDFFVVANAQLPSLTSKKVMGSAGSSDLGVRRFSVTHSLLLRTARGNRLDAALSDPPSDVLEIRRGRRLDLPQVEPAVDFDHHGTDACVAPVPTSRHQRSREPRHEIARIVTGNLTLLAYLIWRSQLTGLLPAPLQDHAA